VSVGSCVEEWLQVFARIQAFLVLLQARHRGQFISTVHLKVGIRNSGIAVLEEGNILAVSNEGRSSITLYDLGSGEEIRTFGAYGSGHGCFELPQHICFSATGTLLVAEGEGMRVQEVTLTGEHVRYIGRGFFEDVIEGIAANSDIVVVTQPTHDTRQVVVFNALDGRPVHSFGTCGEIPGELEESSGVCITQDGRYIIVAECSNERLSMFTVGGDFVRTFCSTHLARPSAVCIADSGVIAVVGAWSHNVVLFSEQGEVLAQFGSEGVGDGEFCTPCAVSVAHDVLYVLSSGSNRVQSFQV
jgi:tripartite motif-containing protein 71